MPLQGVSFFQGIEGSCEVGGREGSVEILAIDSAVKIPVDIDTGEAVGARQHTPMKLVANVDKATPQLIQRLCTAEQIDEVVLKFYKQVAGTEEEYYIITMTNVQVVGVRHWKPNVKDRDTDEYFDMVDYELRYQTINWEFLDGNVAHMDDWKVR